MDLLVPCIVEGRSELRNVGRVNCKTHWPFSGCGTPYLLNVYIACRLSFVFSRSLQRARLRVHRDFCAAIYRSLGCVYTYFFNLFVDEIFNIFSSEQCYAINNLFASIKKKENIST